MLSGKYLPLLRSPRLLFVVFFFWLSHEIEPTRNAAEPIYFLAAQVLAGWAVARVELEQVLLLALVRAAGLLL